VHKDNNLYFKLREKLAATLYATLIEESKKRPERTIEEWVKAEREAMYNTAKKIAEEHNLYTPAMDEIKSAERYALGSVDYATKWSYAIVRLMNGEQI
jgi:hypothetical protein